MKRLFLLLFLLPAMLFAEGEKPYSIVLPNAAIDMASSITQKDFFTFFLLENSSDTTLLLKDIQLGEFVDISTGRKVKAEMTLNGAPATPTLTVGKRQSVQVEIRASFPEEGTYQARLGMEAWSLEKGSTLHQNIQVSYQKEKKSPKGLKSAFYEVTSVYNAAGILGNLRVEMVLQDTAARGGVITQVKPELSLLGSNAEVNSARYGKILILVEGDTLASQLEFEENKPTKVLTLDFSGIRQPGSYKGTVHFSSPGAKTVKKEFTISAKRHWWTALLVISGGLALAILLRWLLTIFQPRIKNQQKVAELMEQAELFKSDNELEAEEAALLRDYLRQLTNLYQLLERETPADLDSTLDILTQKEALFRKWVEARRQVHALRPASLQTTLLPKLKAAHDFIGMSGGDLETAKNLLSSLAEVEPSILQLVGQHVMAQVDKLALASDAELVAAKAEPEKIEAFKREIDKLKNLPVNSKSDLDDLNKAYATLETQYSSLLIASMKGQLASLKNGDRPAEVNAGEWIEVFDPAEKKLDEAEKETEAAERLAKIKEAVRLLLAGIDGQVEKRMNLMIKKKASNPLISQEMIDATKQTHEEAAALLGKWSTMSLAESMDAFGKLMTRAQAGWAPITVTRGSEESGFRGKSLSMFDWSFVSEEMGYNMDGTDLGTLEEVQTTMRKLRFKAFWAEIVSSILIYVVSVGLGLLIWWIPNATWGSMSDILTAIFWGFGLHAVGKSTDITGTVTRFVQGKITA